MDLKFKIAAMMLTVSALFGCTNSAHEEYYPVVPQELADCKFYLLRNSDGDWMRVARCPNSTTSATYQQGKVHATAIVIDGDEYVKKDKHQSAPVER